MSLPYSVGYPIDLPKLVNADNYQEWLEGLRIAAATQPGVTDILFRVSKEKKEPNPNKFFSADSPPLPVPFNQLGIISGSERIQAWNSANMQYRASQAQYARARELLFSSIATLVQPFIAENIRESDHPAEIIDHLETLFDWQGTYQRQVQERDRVCELSHSIGTVHRPNIKSSMLEYLSTHLKHRAIYDNICSPEDQPM
jgi:hypothetical protein